MVLLNINNPAHQSLFVMMQRRGINLVLKNQWGPEVVLDFKEHSDYMLAKTCQIKLEAAIIERNPHSDRYRQIPVI